MYNIAKQRYHYCNESKICINQFLGPERDKLGKYVEDKLFRSSVKELKKLLSDENITENEDNNTGKANAHKKLSQGEKELLLAKVGNYLMKTNKLSHWI